jgi:hypothetical protein
MSILQKLNSKGNIRKTSAADLPYRPQYPVIGRYEATSTASQTVINMTFSVDQDNKEAFQLFIDGKLLREGASNDYQFTSIGFDNTSSQVTLTYSIPANLNIIAIKLGTKKESEFNMDNRFVQIYSTLATDPTVQRFTSNVGTQTGILFRVTAANATVGATYTNNSQTFTVLSTIAGGTLLFTSNTAGVPLASGTLTKASGTGDATITFSSYQTLLTYTTPANTKYIKVRIAGGGGGAGGGSATIGGVTAFGASLLICAGGGAGTNTQTGGTGGSATIGTLPAGAFAFGLKGGDGNWGAQNTTNDAGGSGGVNPFGGGGGSGLAGAANTGAGGGGANSGRFGGGGAGAYIEALIGNPDSTYIYSVGIGGTAGSGGAGGSGVVIVEEYYV